MGSDTQLLATSSDSCEVMQEAKVLRKPRIRAVTLDVFWIMPRHIRRNAAVYSNYAQATRLVERASANTISVASANDLPM